MKRKMTKNKKKILWASVIIGFILLIFAAQCLVIFNNKQRIKEEIKKEQMLSEHYQQLIKNKNKQ